ncbi:MAG: ribonuclease H-like domain-containing protein, partial [Planctomycetota bacterium]
REDDLPGSFAPAAWFDYQAGRPHLLEDVFKHNLDDVLSLVTLTAHVARSLDERDHAGRELSGDGLARARGLAKLAAERKDGPQQLRWLELGIGRVDRDAAPALHRSLELERTSALERVGEPERAILELLRLIEGGDEFAARGSVRAALLLQRAKRLEEALVVARQGRELVDRRLHGAERLRSLEQLDRRIEALEARLART